MNYQKTTIIGRITHDHELRYTPKGTAVLENTTAVNRRWKDGNGQKQEECTFYDWKAWGATAEALSNYTVKGSPILLEMRMVNERWEDKQTGAKRSKCVFVVERFEFMEAAGDTNARGENRPAQQADGPGEQHDRRNHGQPQQGGQQAVASDFEDEGDDIPF